MNTKRLITASIFSLISASTALAADVLIPHQTAPSTPSSTIVAPTFSWTGLYLGVQAGGFSSKSDMALVDQEKGFPLDKEFSPKLSGFAGGFYAGSNIDLGDSFIFGIDTDLMISGKKHTKTINIGTDDNVTVEKSVGRFRKSAEAKTSSQTTGTQEPKVVSVNTTDSGTTTVGTQAVKSAEPSKPATGASTVGAPNALAQTTSSSSVTKPQAGTSSLTPSSPATPSSSPVKKSQTESVLTGTNKSAGTGVSRQLSSSSSVKSDTGNQASGVGTSGASASTKSAEVGSAKPAEKAPVSSVPSTKSETSQTAVKSPTSGQSSLAARTVPSEGALALTRSGSSNGSETKTSSGTSGTQNGAHHSAHGSGNSNPHGAPHAAGHGSGANPHGSHGASPHASRPHGAQSVQAADKSDSSIYGIEQMKKMASELGLEQGDEVETLNHTFKQNWGGATRVRIGFAADRFMPYLAGGIAYGQFQDTVSVSVKGEDGTVVSSRNLTDETKTMIGYTLGGGVDFSVLDNVIVRAEYRYSDFGKKKLAKEKLEINYKTNDFRVGVAYKF
ncbi:outer membrane beta-barrel protein [Bartonella krasnovii]|uniref:outer membrane beta-barrel protein n=1 Tax=Bartonella krasnovii TaxID=2267275 RepID=UPI001F4CE448|nr:outer membrane beta-barrel protein [Bartonella krasnovii]UNF44059.1 outer membrane beta-barrel protein [Bartonella krasnovii]